MNKDFKDIEGKLNKLPELKLSKAADKKILAMLDEALEAKENESRFDVSRLFAFKPLLSFAVILLFVFGGTQYFQGVAPEAPESAMMEMAMVAKDTQVTTIKDVDTHVLNARIALNKLQLALQGQEVAWIPTAYAQDEDVDIDEELITELTEEVVSEIDAAVAATENVEEAEELQSALEEISDLQDETVEVFTEATEVVEDEIVTEFVVDALEDTVDQQEQVDVAVDTVETAIEAGEERPRLTIERRTDLRTKRQLRSLKKPVKERITELKEKHEAQVIKRVERKKAQAERMIEKRAEHLEELKERGATDEEIAAFEDRVNRLETAVQSGDLKLLREQGKEVRKTRHKKMEEKREAVLEKKVESGKITPEEKEEIIERHEERRETFREEVKEELKDLEPKERREKIEEKREEAAEKREQIREEKREAVKQIKEEDKNGENSVFSPTVREKSDAEIRERLQNRRRQLNRN